MNAMSPPQKAPLPPGFGKQVAKSVGGSTVEAFFEQNKGAIASILPRHMTADRMVKIALRCLRTTPRLLECSLNSLVGAVITCAQLGLEPNTPQGHVYLIPFENRKKKTFEVQVIIGYKGLIDLARRSGEIESITSRVVYFGDQFDIEYGTEEKIKHRPETEKDPGAICGVYAVAKFKDGGTQFEYMSLSQVNRIRDGSQGYLTAKRFGKTDTPWIANYEAMARKTVIRRLCNYLPMSVELAGALDLDDRGAANKAQGLEKVLDGVEYTELSETEEEDGAEGGATEATEGAETDAKTSAPAETAKSTAPAEDKPKQRASEGTKAEHPPKLAKVAAEPAKAAAPAPAPEPEPPEDDIPPASEEDLFGSGE